MAVRQGGKVAMVRSKYGEKWGGCVEVFKRYSLE
jgi:hypothetical protein